MLVTDYIQIAKDEFPYLFQKYGFKVAYTEQEKKWRYAFGIESETYKMRMLFSRQQGAGVIYLGPLAAPFNNEFSYKLWVEIANLLMYLNRQRVDWSTLDAYTDEERIRPAFRLISAKFEPHCPRALEMFSSDKAIAAWRPAYDQYIKQM